MEVQVKDQKIHLYQMSLICSYCEPGGMDCEPGRINASPLSLNVSREHFSFAVSVSRNMR
ncbi:hypothetical protein FPE53_24760 [Salmonella enterica subsp. enterica]|uniref:Uncharacterized protein n=1 Tax=Salmonella enterica subsp. enterica serovar Aqua TaxID=1302615 RepID=A0A5X6ERI9_SALET|nr:hypothetical protein [Salmonella enterica subsp. enterica serovar Aqua]ECC9721951.1 hypothetical protein [Salmonella enterica subsp. diarizonae]ECH1172397.1 hypothetical protein [Salmonella enterica subsp. enterica serovar Aqua]